MKTQSKIEFSEYFIPASALEHHENGENFSLNQKIIWALIRLTMTKDFKGNIELGSSTPYVLLNKATFNKDQMGYDVQALIKSG